MDRPKNGDIFVMPVENQNRTVTRNKSIAVVAATLLTLSVCWPSQLSEERFEQSAAAMAVEPEAAHMYKPTINTTIPPHSEITLETSTTSSTTTPEADEVDTPNVSANSHDYVPSDCSQGDTLRVNVTGQNGAAINAQVSVDYMLGDQKVDTSGSPINPYEGYSDYVYINSDVPPQGSVEGTREVCFQNIPHGASVYVESYSLARVDGDGFVDVQHIATEEYYGHSMSHQLWPGNGQIVYLRQPSACAIGGNAGSISTTIHGEDGSLLTSNRVAAWDNGQKGRSGFAYGFGVEDVVYNGSQQENSLKTLMSDRAYTLQVQSKDQRGNDAVFVMRDVPVDSCKDTPVSINITNDGCQAVVDEKQLRCTLNKEFIG